MTQAQTVTVQNLGNLCLANHERIASSAYQTFQIQDIIFDSLHQSPNMAAFVSNNHTKFFVAQNNGTLTTPSYSYISSIYYHPTLYKGNAVSGRFNNDNYVDYALVNALGDILTFKNTGYPLPFVKDSLGDSFLGSHISSKLLKCNIDGTGYDDVLTFGIRGSFFAMRSYLNLTGTAAASPLTFSAVPLRFVATASLPTFGYDVEAADLGGDSRDELVFVSEASDTVYVLYSSPTGNYDLVYKYKPTISGVVHKKVVLADLNRDGKPEITLSGVLSGNMHYVGIYAPVYISGNIVSFNNFNSVYSSTPITDFSFADLNVDGFKDLVLSQLSATVGTTSNIDIYLQNRVLAQPFQFLNAPITVSLQNHINGGVSICDVDYNGREDIISFSTGSVSSIALIKDLTYRDSLYAIPNKTTICLGDTIVLKNDLLGFNGGYLTNLVPTQSTIASSNHSTAVTSSGIFTVQASYTTYMGGICAVVGNPINLLQGSQPVLSVAGPSAVCNNGAQTILTAGGASSFTWAVGSSSISSGFLPLTPTITTSYILSGTSPDGCVASMGGTLTVRPDVNASITYDKNFLCKGQLANLTAVGGITYSWSTNQLGPNIAITQTASFSQNYSVLVTDTNGCSKYATFSTNYNDKCSEITVITGITPNSDGENDHLYIENIENYPDNVVHIYNRWGRQLYYQKGYDNTTKVWPAKNSQNLMSGTYYYVLDLGPGTESKKGWVEVFSN